MNRAGASAKIGEQVSALLEWADSPIGPGLSTVQDYLEQWRRGNLPPAFVFFDYLQFVCQDPRYQQVRDLYTETEVLIPLEAETVEPQTSSDVDIQADEAKQLKVERFPVLEGLQKYALGEQRQHLLLAGRPGSGKSTTLKRLLLERADAALERPEMIPVYVQLKGDRPIIELILAEFRRAKVRVSPEQLEDWLLEDRLLLLLDGVNEISSDQQRRALQTFREDNPATAMIFTTRDLAVGGDLGIQKRLEMRPLSEAQMREFVNKYLTQRGLPNQADTLLRQLKDRLREVAETPLLLKMLCDVFDSETRQIPQSKGELFRLFDAKYDQFKGLAAVSDDFRRFKPELLRHLAFCMLQSDHAKPTAAWLTLDRNQAESLLEHYLSGRVEAPGQRAKEWLEDLLEHHLLQVAANPRELEFHHQLFQEYYAAEALLILLPELLRDEAKFKRDYLNYLKWTESIALMLSLVDDEAQALRVVKLAIDDVDLMLGARLAGEVNKPLQAKTVGWIDALEIPIHLKVDFWAISRSEAAISGLLQSLQDPDSGVRSSAAQVLGKIGSEAAIPGLLQALQHQDPGVREIVAVVLGDIGSEATIPGLLQALQDLDSDVRKSATEALGKIGSEAAIPGLLQALQDPDWDVRSSAAMALGKIGSEAAIPGLLQALQDPDSDVRRISAMALENIGREATIPDLLQALQDLDWGVRGIAVAALGKIGSEATIPDLLRALQDPHSDVRKSAAVALGKIGSEATILGLLQALQDPDADVCRRAAEALGKLGSEAAIPGLIQALQHPDADVRWRAAEGLGKLGSEAAIPGLLQALQHPDADVRWRAAMALGKIGSETAIPGLLQALQDPDWGVLRHIAGEALGSIGSEATIPSLIQALQHQDSDVRKIATEVLGSIGSEATIPNLIQALQDPDSGVRRIAAMALRNIGSEAAIPGLLQALQDPDSGFRQIAVAALGSIGSEATIPDLLQTLQDPDSGVRGIAAVVLGDIGSKAAISSLLQALQDQDSGVRKSAAVALGSIGSEAAISSLLQALQDPDSGVRGIAAEALGSIGSEATIPSLLQALQHPDWGIRRIAVAALGKIGSEATIPGLLQALQDRNSYVCSSAAVALGKIGSEAAISSLLQALQHPDWDVRSSAVVVLRKFGGERIAILWDQILQTRGAYLRQIAIESLGKILSEDSITLFSKALILMSIINALRDRYPGVRRSAIEALRRIGNPRPIGLLWRQQCSTSSMDSYLAIAAIQNHCQLYNYELWYEAVAIQNEKLEVQKSKQGDASGQVINQFPNATEVRIFERVENYHDHPLDSNT
ncbi:HEAT repeat domain-containing protein [Nodosilinea sp. PGN35]|uniref:HEAT repeat domain-containing protein n=1 Tax=Nodosilinea sp. PGN35 TaxID=3020489 RepID=UPI00398AA794